MNTTEAADLAAELRKAAQDLLLCVNAIVGQEQSLATDLLRHFPGRLELLALRIAPRPQADMPPDWPQWNASGEDHFQALLERQRWRLQCRSERRAL
ncbi:hypothetical protein E4O93_02145 [Diaphorobacter sp. DS2]|uniref:hypothetical protein n=1 Tax=unclassified Diaphorobacter TaxID=2649760 RepID=UPI0002DD053E|nr:MULTISPECIES: hypothetical protein [unclassified Diaphorobacter]MCA0325068.1 hypothetical protein [Pseudomonadota bacterium]QPN32677.1 hypothetical protein I3K84_08965 [Diaphorobacter sp. JS3051]QYY26400.1 hypothetical protein K2L43_04270 [Diaphorobacter sp. MNS-0]TFI49549.1 hypothetical protein E4O93_02145 [Diaphorobacter sp. DS2]